MGAVKLATVPGETDPQGLRDGKQIAFQRVWADHSRA
jgi:hypothetical protein